MKLKHKNSRCKQLRFEGNEYQKVPVEFGGSLLGRSNSKIKRPISTKNCMHLTLKSSMAKFENSFIHYRNKRRIENLIYSQARLFNIKIYRLSINFNHIHIQARFFFRESYAKFIRSISGNIVRLVLGIKRGAAKLAQSKKLSHPIPEQSNLKFWDFKPYTRIINWARDFKNVLSYIEINMMESLNISTQRKPTKYVRINS